MVLLRCGPQRSGDRFAGFYRVNEEFAASPFSGARIPSSAADNSLFDKARVRCSAL
jgi:hypothetical protein